MRISLLCDEDCSGIIRKEEYLNCLQAYSINEEKSSKNIRSFGQ